MAKIINVKELKPAEHRLAQIILKATMLLPKHILWQNWQLVQLSK